MDKKIIEDIIEWDVVNWSKALDFWAKNTDLENQQYQCLELGGRRGGLSLWLAMKNNHVICSDISSPEEHASKLHTKHSYSGKIDYQAIDATNITYENHFDVVIFKSILGGISSNNNDYLKKQAISEIYKSLKPSGKLLFAENLEASFMHRFFRKRFVTWGGGWNYLKHTEIAALFESFENLEYQTIGFLGTFGRTERQRRILGIIDSIIKPIIPKKKRYIVFGMVTKPNKA